MIGRAEASRIAQLDGLRGLAVLAVVGFHFLNNQYAQVDPSQLNAVEKFLMKATYFGWAGVDLFFVLSGFLIGTILLNNRESDNFLKTFYIRRFFRIVPIYYLLLVIFFILKQLPLYNTDIYIFYKPLPLGYYFAFLQNFVMSCRGHFGPEGITPTWSLAVEEQFYLIIPLVVYFFRPSLLKYFVIACLIVAPVSRYFSTNWYMQYTLLTSRIDSPIMGFLVALLLQTDRIKTVIVNNLVTVKLSAVVLLTLSIGIYVFSDIGVFNHTVIAIIFSLILIVLLFTESGVVYELLTSRFLVFIGGISYFIYLFHQIVNGLFHLLFLDQKMPLLDNAVAMYSTIAAFLFTLVAASLSYQYLEKPLIDYSHRFKYRFGNE